MSINRAAIRLPREDGNLEEVGTFTAGEFDRPDEGLRSRRLLAAAHVVADPLSGGPGAADRIDVEASLDYRRHLWSWGLGVAEAMDTAQRGMGLTWPAARVLIARSVEEARACRGDLVCGAQTDHLEARSVRTLHDVELAYEEQVGFIEGLGGRVVLMASRDLVHIASGPDDYLRVYGRILSQLAEPAIIHWLGEVFDPLLAGYWGVSDLDEAMDVLLEIVEDNVEHVDGIKLSLLDQPRELEMRKRLPKGIRMYTGDDFDYPTLIRGDGEHHSDALLGILDAIAPAAATAVAALDRKELDRFDSLLDPTIPLARKVFESPTYYYKTGLTFIAYLNGHQNHFRMLGGMESARSIIHLADVYRFVGASGLLEDPERSAFRMRTVLNVAGIPQ
jgi:Protein of unknown function (DUF993)